MSGADRGEEVGGVRKGTLVLLLFINKVNV